MKRFFILTLIFIVVLSTTKLFSQIGNIRVYGGLTTVKILGDNPAVKPIIERDTSKAYIVGGSFDVPQNGLFLVADIALDEEENFVIPLGIEYYFYRSAERIPVSFYITYLYKNALDIQTVFTGFKYKMFKLPASNTKMYAELKVTANFINQADFYREDRLLNQNDTIRVAKSKSNATRFGGNIKIGFEGEIIHPVYIDMGISYGVMNLLGRDTNIPELDANGELIEGSGRGELLTPVVQSAAFLEGSESYVQTLNYFISIKYKL